MALNYRKWTSAFQVQIKSKNKELLEHRQEQVDWPIKEKWRKTERKMVDIKQHLIQLMILCLKTCNNQNTIRKRNGWDEHNKIITKQSQWKRKRMKMKCFMEMKKNNRKPKENREKHVKSIDNKKKWKAVLRKITFLEEWGHWERR